jgi:hypothetical protein
VLDYLSWREAVNHTTIGMAAYISENNEALKIGKTWSWMFIHILTPPRLAIISLMEGALMMRCGLAREHGNWTRTNKTQRSSFDGEPISTSQVRVVRHLQRFQNESAKVEHELEHW